MGYSYMTAEAEGVLCLAWQDNNIVLSTIDYPLARDIYSN